MVKGGYVYIVSNWNREIFYVGVISNLSSRSWEHKNEEGSKFTTKYNCTDLIYFEVFESIVSAIEREKQLKNWNRKWKEDLVKKMNPEMKDLYEEVADFK